MVGQTCPIKTTDNPIKNIGSPRMREGPMIDLILMKAGNLNTGQYLDKNDGSFKTFFCRLHDSRTFENRPPVLAQNQTHPPTHHTQHDELIKYIYDSWSKVEMDRSSNNIVYYQEHENQQLKVLNLFHFNYFLNKKVIIHHFFRTFVHSIQKHFGVEGYTKAINSSTHHSNFLFNYFV